MEIPDISNMHIVYDGITLIKTTENQMSTSQECANIFYGLRVIIKWPFLAFSFSYFKLKDPVDIQDTIRNKTESFFPPGNIIESARPVAWQLKSTLIVDQCCRQLSHTAAQQPVIRSPASFCPWFHSKIHCSMK